MKQQGSEPPYFPETPVALREVVGTAEVRVVRVAVRDFEETRDTDGARDGVSVADIVQELDGGDPNDGDGDDVMELLGKYRACRRSCCSPEDALVSGPSALAPTNDGKSVATKKSKLNLHHRDGVKSSMLSVSP